MKISLRLRILGALIPCIISGVVGASATSIHRDFLHLPSTATALFIYSQTTTLQQPNTFFASIAAPDVTITSIGTGGNWNAAGTWSPAQVPVAGDIVIIKSGTTVTINNDQSCNNITIEPGGTLQINGTNKLTVNGNWENNGTFTTSVGGIIEFGGSTSATISGSQTTNFKNLVVNKTPGRTTLLEINGTATILSGGLLTMTSGLLQINALGDLDCNHNTQINISTAAGIHVNGGNFSTGDFSVNNNGLFQVSSGTATLGADTGNSLQTGTNGTFQMDGGTLNIAGRLVNTAGTANITGGTINLSTLGHASSTLASFEMSSSTILNITGGTITFTEPNGSLTTPSDIVLISGAGAKTITGGTFQFGTDDTTVPGTFIVNSDIPLFNLTVFNNNSTISLTDNLTIKNQLTLNGQLLLNDKILYLPANAIAGTFGATGGMIVDNQGTSGGEVRLTVSVGGGIFTLPVGDNTGSSTDYSPVTLSFGGGNAADAWVAVQTINTQHPNNQNTDNYLNRYWAVETSGINGSWDFSATYSVDDVIGDAANIDLGTYIGSVWTKGNPANTGANTISITGITASSLEISGISDVVPEIEITNGVSATICSGFSIQLTTSVTADEPHSFSWVSDPAGFTSTDANPTVSPLVATKYTVTLTDGNGFTASDEITVNVDPVSVGGSIAGSATVCAGTNSTSLTLSGHTGTIEKWQFSTDNGSTWTDIANTTDSYTATNLTATTQYQALVKSGVCDNTASVIATVTVDPVSVGGSIAGSATVCSGTNSTSLTLSGHTGTIEKWQFSTDNGSTWTDIANTTDSYTATNLTATTQYQALVKSGVCDNTPSVIATVTVDPVSVGGSVAGGTTICSGSASGALTLTGHTGAVTKWQSSVSPFSTWTDISNTTTTYTSGTLTQTTQFRAVVVSGVCSSANSAATTVTVDPPSVGGAATASNATLCSGNSTTITVSGYTGSIQWQQSPDGTSSWANVTGGSGATTATYTTPNLTATTYYRAIVTSGTCTAQASTNAQVTIDPISVGGTVSSAQTICSGSSPSDLTLSGHTGNVVRWERSADAGFTSPTTIANTTTSLTSATIGNLTGNTYFRAVVKSGICAEAPSASVLITVDPLSVGGTVSASQTICYNTQPANLTLSGNVGNVVRWERSANAGFTSPTPISINTTTLTSATIGNLTTNTYFRAIVKSGTCSESASSTVLITVNDILAISKSIVQTPTKPGDNFSYQISYSNLNPSCDATGVVIKDYLPAGNFFNYISSTPSGTFDNATRTITWNFENVSPGNHTITINGELGTPGNPNWPTYDPASNYIATGSLASTLVSNNATIESATVAPTSIFSPITNSVSQFCDFNIPLTLSGYVKSSNPAYTYYVITITNTGNITDRFTFTTDQTGTDSKQILIPSFLNLNGTALTPARTPWLEPNEPFTFLMRFDVPGGTQPNNTNYTHLTSTSFVCQTSKVTDINTFIYGGNVAGAPDLSITKTATPYPAIVGNNLAYTITVNNTSPNEATNVSISDVLDPNVTIGTFSATAGVTLTYNSTTRTLSASKTSLKNSDAPIRITLNVTPNCSSIPSVTNNVSVDNNNGDSNIANDSFILITPVISNIIEPTAAGTTTCEGLTASLTANGALSGYGYKWYDASTGGTLLHTGSSFTTPALSTTTTYYAAIYEIASPACESSRTPVTVTVLATPVYTTQPSNQIICDNETTSFYMAATGTLLSYQWQVDSGSGWTNLSNVPPFSGVDTNTLTVTNATFGMNGYLFRAITRSGTCTGVNSNTATLTVNPLPTCLISGTDAPVCPSSTNTFTAPAGMTSYSWIIISGGASFSGASNQQSVTVVSPSGCNTSYELSVTITNANNCTSDCSKTVTVQDITNPTITCPPALPVPPNPSDPSATVNISDLVNKTYVHAGTGWNATATDNCSTPTLTAVLTGVTNLSGLSTLDNVAFNIGVTTVKWTATDACGRTSECSFNIEVLGTADLEITKTGADVNASVGDEFIYTISVKNNGPVATPINSVTISDAVPAAFTNPQYSTDGGTSWIAWTGSYQPTASIANGASVPILLRGTPVCSAIGSLSNTATVSLSQITDPDLTNNTSTESTLIEDDTDPTFDLPTLASGYCVEDIYQAVYNDDQSDPVLDLTYPRPDYYLFAAGFTHLNLSNVADNCALKSPEPISWTIDFGNDGSVNLSGTGQLENYVPIAPALGIEFPLGTNRITYTVTDAAGNTTVQYRDLVVLPRPDITRNF